MRISRELKEAEKALETEIRRARKQRFKALLEEELKNINLTAEEWVEAVRERQDWRDRHICIQNIHSIPQLYTPCH